MLCTVQLVPTGQFLSGDISNDQELESHRLVINSKLIDVAVSLCDSPRLDVWILETDARNCLSTQYNHVWDCLLVHQKVRKVDARIVFKLDERSKVVWSAGLDVHPQSHPSATSLRSHLEDEVRMKFVLYDNPQDRSGFLQSHVAMGGTFDQLHPGHKKLLLIAVQCTTSSLIVGVTSDAMLTAKKGADKIEPFQVRKSKVVEYLQSVKERDIEINVVTIDDPFGPAVSEPNLTGIVCSSETLKGASAINSEREKRGFKPLVPIVTLRSNAYVLSSTFLREMTAL